jgi:hypothetical protein
MNDVVLNALHQRISIMEKMLELRGKQIDTISEMFEDLLPELQKIQPALDERTEMAFKLSAVIGSLGLALVAAGAVPREYLVAVRDTTNEELGQDASDSVKLLLKSFDCWAKSAPTPDRPVFAAKPCLTVVADNEVTAAGD